VSDLFLYDDAIARAFEPFALTRPVSELRAGALLLRERWERALGLKAAGVVTSSHLQDFDEPWGIGAARGVMRAGSVVANSRFAVAVGQTPDGDVWRAAGKVAAVRLNRNVDVEELIGEGPLDSLVKNGGRAVDVAGRWIERVWDLIGQLPAMLKTDIAALIAAAPRAGTSPSPTTGSHPVFMEEGAVVEPHVFFDTSEGPVYLSSGARIQAFTRVVGPTFVGRDSIVTTDKIAAASIGDVCRVHGEVICSVFLGHSNKAHDGFLGHSYLGRWVNLGAGTITSNLKNTYSSVEFWTPTGERDSGEQFLGTFFGDHTKTGIGTVLNTGTLIGAGANIFGGAMPPKVISPFAWGERPPYST
jgi:UDP-N-acetylglucosamine diphosphorylase / glucose-1-phosphate thymidylyltransferase / UDP-N-acetylgalactosamine diphosphorylase / glucosamine-1-phosphate N-acetyltransferase / galactosamine-1-phosphate N-acetyltransferase